MKQISIFIVFAIITFTLTGLSDSKNNSPKAEWKRFKEEFNKTYESNGEDEKRYKIFKKNLVNILNHNKRYEEGKETYLQDINRFADLTDKEFSDIYGLSELSGDNIVHYNEEIVANKSSLVNVSSEYFDWREFGAVTPAKDQGKCGSCWIFSAVSALESYNFIQTGQLLSLSEQNVVDCYSNDTCEGGSPYEAADFIQDHGIYLESDYPYTAGQDPCRNITKPSIHIDFNSTYFAFGGDEMLKEGIKQHGPLSICLYVTAKWRFYSSGVWYHNECSPHSNHCVVIVGYGTENGNDYWLMKNSWGINWGQDGYIKVARNKHPNYCGIDYGMYYVSEEKIEENSEENEI
ncbi:procathepsin L-like [Diorhabda carinulata]|uniref:procathepsin L-like n=1 Tax=Diorhabda carinulata TaxID=1163345 RepID=UPI0025A015C3|nr:procathepsin L-like [Diorhabda carinulata]